MASYEEILESCTDRMQSSLNNFSNNLKKIRTGRANPAMLDGIMVDYYGNMTPLNQCCSITVEDSKTLSLSPWDKGLVQEIDKAIDLSFFISCFEIDVLPLLAKNNLLGCFKHDGFWQPMDTLRDKKYLQSLWLSNKAPWKIWN